MDECEHSTTEIVDGTESCSICGLVLNEGIELKTDLNFEEGANKMIRLGTVNSKMNEIEKNELSKVPNQKKCKKRMTKRIVNMVSTFDLPPKLIKNILINSKRFMNNKYKNGYSFFSSFSFLFFLLVFLLKRIFILLKKKIQSF